MKIHNTPEDVAFLLQESGLSLVDSVDVLQASDPAMTERTPYLPKGTTKAHEWMVRNGDPTTSTEAAYRMAARLGDIQEFEIRGGTGRVSVELQYPNRRASAVAENLPLALCAAALNSLDRKTWGKK